MTDETLDEVVKPKFNLSSYQKLVIVLLALTQFTVVLDFMVMSPLGDFLTKSMDLTQKQFGVVVAVYALSAGVSGFLTAGFADRYDRKKLLLFFYIGFILGTLFCGLAVNYNQLLAARIITGIFGGVIGSISMAIVADLFLPEQRGRVMGFMQTGFAASQVLGIPVSLYLATKFDWEAPFFMIVGLALLIWIIIAFKLNPVNKHLEIKSERNALKHLWNTIKQKEYRVGYLATAFLSLGGFMMMPWGSAYAVNNLGVSQANLAWLFSVAGIASLIIMPIVGKLSDRFDKFKLFTIASVWMIVVVIAYTNIPPLPLWGIMIFNIAMMAGIFSRMVPSQAMASELPQMQDRGAFMSINSSLSMIAGGVAAGIGGMIIVQDTETSPIENYNTVGIVVSSITVVCIFLMYRVSNVIKNRKSEN